MQEFKDELNFMEEDEDEEDMKTNKEDPSALNASPIKMPS